MKFCKNCGSKIEDGTKFCKNCGRPVEGSEINKQKDNMERIKKSKNNIWSGVFPKVTIGVILIATILVGVFLNRIKGQYYFSKCNSAVTDAEKIDYAVKAVKAFDSTDNKELLKKTLTSIAENNVELAEKELEETSGVLSQGEFKSIASEIKEKKVDKLCNQSNYSGALNEFSEIDKLGGDFKLNKNYDTVMLNTIAKLTGGTLQNNKNILLDDKSICYDNFDDDQFDEIIELKDAGSSYSYKADVKVNLYKFKDGKYSLVDSKIITNNSTNKKNIEGVHDYTTNKKGVFIQFQSVTEGYGIAVLGVNSSKLEIKGTIFGRNYIKAEDVDNDGSYEILSNSVSNITSTAREISKWYKVYEDARTPTEVTVDGTNNATINEPDSSKSDYILKDSNKAYLVDNDLKNLSKDELAFARNEIFARHGYIFGEERFKTYFSKKSWYIPNSSYDGSDAILNEYEVANYKFIQEWESK